MPPKKLPGSREVQHKEDIVIAAAAAAAAAVAAMYAPHFLKIPKNNGSRGGAEYIQELFEGHPSRFYEVFGMTKHTFRRLATELFKYTSFSHTKYISMAEQLAIFLRFCRYGYGVRKIEEEFLRSPDTISK